MIRGTLIAAALLGAAPALAQPTRAVPETKVRNMVDYLEAVPDPQRGVYIRGYTGLVLCARARQLPAPDPRRVASLQPLAGRRFRPRQHDPRRRLALHGRERDPIRRAAAALTRRPSQATRGR